MLARTKTQKRNSLSFTILCLAALALALGLLSFFMLKPAQGSGETSNGTIGIGQKQSTQASETQFDSAEKLDAALPEDEDFINDKDVSGSASLASAAQRSITVKDPDPVITFTAIDTDNEDTVEKAAAVGCLDPLPTAPRILPDTSEDGWVTGLASAYDLETNQGWDATASGILLDRGSITVAVPASQAHLLGSAVEIVYEDKVVVATVTDTGGFAKYGRSLDLAAGVWKAFGASSYGEWGVRTVHYRFL